MALLMGSLLLVCTPNDNIDPDDPNVYSEQAYPGTTGEIVQLTVSGETITCEKINEEYIFQGDILLQPPTRGAVYAEGNLWPDNKVYYTINSNLPDPERVTQAIEYYHTTTNLTFIERTNQPNYIDFIYDANGCSSYLGMIGGIQPIRLADWGTKGNVIHEIGHAIGLLHEHSKVGRDQYVTINEENIEEGKQHNFTEYRSSNPNTDGFDFESIMLYSSYAFSKNGQPTIVRKNGKGFNAQRSQLSENDLEIIDQIYPGIPSVVTLSITDITENSAISGGNITADGGAAVTVRGVCWSTSENPTTANSKTTDGTGVGDFTSNLTGLSPSTTYYVKAYATNSKGTAYGEQKTFTTAAEIVIPTVATVDVT
ncbi:MAG: M12 family metallopeptidase, partial [Bacteroidales bacterium]|nr:M12 family metallopeptidase [Bacteroidales bacterium]